MSAWAPRPHPQAATAGIRVAGGHGARPRRIVVTPQRHYWRTIAAELHAASPPITINADGTAANSIGPQAAGERWDVHMVQVQTASQTQQPPFVVSQIRAQQTGGTTPQPPPIVCQVWLLAGQGTRIHLLGQTTQGGWDNLGIACPMLTAGERLRLDWYNATPGDTAWAVIRGTKYVLDT